MTTQPPYVGRTAGQSTASNDDFGPATVSGTPKSGSGSPPGGAGTAAGTRSGDGSTTGRRAPENGAQTTTAVPRPTAPPPPPSAAPRPPSPPGAPAGGPKPSGSPPGPNTALGQAPAPGPIPNAAGPHKTNRTDRLRGPRRARLQLRHINPWTVLKFSCVLSIALFFVWLIVVGVLFGILDAAGVVGKINDSVVLINGSGSKAPVTAGIVFGGAAIIGVVNIVLFIALSTIGSVVYNLCADLVGGVELTLSES
jgi:hypothetical protein